MDKNQIVMFIAFIITLFCQAFGNYFSNKYDTVSIRLKSMFITLFWFFLFFGMIVSNHELRKLGININLMFNETMREMFICVLMIRISRSFGAYDYPSSNVKK